MIQIFQRCHESANDDNRVGRPSSSTTDEFLLPGTTINKEYNLGILHDLHEAICSQWSEL